MNTQLVAEAGGRAVACQKAPDVSGVRTLREPKSGQMFASGLSSPCPRSTIV